MGVWDLIPPEALHGLECHGCNHATTGYQLGELVVDHGWRLHSRGVGRPLFILCGDCQARYSARWQMGNSGAANGERRAA